MRTSTREDARDRGARIMGEHRGRSWQEPWPVMRGRGIRSRPALSGEGPAALRGRVAVVGR
jgi:hypothetical protein